MREAVDRGIPVLGVCLGAQLLAHALGGQRQPAAGAHDPLDGDRAARRRRGRPGGRVAPARRGRAALERGRLRAAGGRRRAAGAAGAARAEAFRYGECAWGVQFHPEVDPPGSKAGTAPGWPSSRGGGHRGAGPRRRRAAPPRPARRSPRRSSAASPAWSPPAASPRDVPALAVDPDALAGQRRLRARQQCRVLRVLRHRHQRVPDHRGWARHPCRVQSSACARSRIATSGPLCPSPRSCGRACGWRGSAGRRCATRSACSALALRSRPLWAGSSTCSWIGTRGGRPRFLWGCGLLWSDWSVERTSTAAGYGPGVRGSCVSGGVPGHPDALFSPVQRMKVYVGAGAIVEIQRNSRRAVCRGVAIHTTPKYT